MGTSPAFAGRLATSPGVSLWYEFDEPASTAGFQLSLTTRSGIHKRQTILIVDDEPNLRNLVHATIDSPVYQVIEARDGEEAWILIKERKPDLVLLDLKMPKRSGLEVLTAIRADPALRGIQVMVLTSSDQQSDIDAGILAGADYYLTKPFSPADLVARVSEAIGQRVPSW
jgi:DNA-binding response OmpR family regulator